MNKPLAGLRIVVTRAAHQADELAHPLAELGAEVILLPTIGIGPPANPEPLENAILNIDSYDWIVFTSANGVRAMGKQECRARVATVGAATRDVAERNGWAVDLTPESYVAEALVEAFGEVKGQRILVPSAAVTRDVVRAELVRRGAVVDVVEAYRNAVPAEAAATAKEVFRVPFPEWITFASSSAVENLAGMVAVEALRQSRIASIGPVTSNTVRECGLSVAAEAQPHDIAGLVAAIVSAETRA